MQWPALEINKDFGAQLGWIRFLNTLHGFQIDGDVLNIAFIPDVDIDTIAYLNKQIYEETSAQTVVFDTYIGRDYFYINRSERELIPAVINVILRTVEYMRLMTMLQVTYQKGETFSIELSEEKYISSWCKDYESLKVGGIIRPELKHMMLDRLSWHLKSSHLWKTPSGRIFAKEIRGIQIEEEDEMFGPGRTRTVSKLYAQARANGDMYSDSPEIDYPLISLDIPADVFVNVPLMPVEIPADVHGNVPLPNIPLSNGLLDDGPLDDVALDDTDVIMMNVGTPLSSSPVEEAVGPHVEPDVCCICMDAPPSTMCLPCEHVVVCDACSRLLESSTDALTCVRCRCAIENILYDVR